MQIPLLTFGASNENKFMHAVSSNYPEASYTYTQGFWGGWNWDLGTRAEGSDFYKSASNADDLDKVFEGISSEIVKGVGYPTNATEALSIRAATLPSMTRWAPICRLIASRPLR